MPKRRETSVVLIVFVEFSRTSTLIPLLFAQHEQGTRLIISWSMTVYYKQNIQSMQFDSSNRTSAGQHLFLADYKYHLTGART